MNRRVLAIGAAVAVVVLVVVVLALRSSDDGADHDRADGATTTVPTPTSEPPDDEPPGTEGEAQDEGEGDAPSTTQGPDPGGAGGGGTIHEEAEVVPGDVTDSVALGSPAEADAGVVVELQVAPIQVEGRRPGERSGPGVAITVEIANDSGADVAVDGVTVDLVTADGTSAVHVADPTTDAPPGALAPGERRSGTYVFALPGDQRAGISVFVKYAADAPTVVFVGDAPGG